MKNILNLLIFLNTYIIVIERRINCAKELVKCQGEDVQQIYHANRIRFRLCKECSKKAARCYDVVVVGFLFEIFQGVQRLRTFLNLIKNNECFSRKDFFTSNHGKKINNPMRILVGFKDGFQFILFVKVEIDKTVIAALSKFFHKPCLADLTCTF